MYYELYIDVFFLVNFMMDSILLLLTRKILKCSATHGWVFLGAAVGAFLTCVVMVIPISAVFVKFILFHGFVNVVMIKIGLKIRWDKMFIKAFLLLYVSGFLMGGVLGYLNQYVRTGSLFFALSVASYYVVLGIWNLISYMARVKNNRCQVTLFKNGKSCTTEALIDTGNCLKDSVTGKPVSVVDKSVAACLYDTEYPEGLRYIAYHSVGKGQGIMPLLTLDYMVIADRGNKSAQKPLIAVSEEQIAEEGIYKMILNPDLL